MEDYLNKYVLELLHIEDVTKNKLISLNAGDLSKTIYLSNKDADNLSEYTLNIIRGRVGKVGNTILNESSAAGKKEQHIGQNLNMFDWQTADNGKDVKKLLAFITDIYKNIFTKGNNPLFLSVGALRWQYFYKDEPIELLTPLLIFPIKIVRNGLNSPLSIEFIQEDAYINPCFTERLKASINEEIMDGFPHPNGKEGLDAPIDLARLGDGAQYFYAVNAYLSSLISKTEDGTVFEFMKDVVAISAYNHEEVCMYYDIKNHYQQILDHPLVKRIFTQNETSQAEILKEDVPSFILSHDSYQEKMITSAIHGNSMIIKGPPGTGKTLTIANMIGALLNQNKRILFASKKLAALSEVRAKLPENLRPFTLLLDSETEAQAAKNSPIELKMELRNLLEKRKNYHFDENTYKDLTQVENNYLASSTQIVAYYDALFQNKPIFGNSIYEGLNTYFKNTKLPIIPLGQEEILMQMDKSLLNKELEIVKTALSEYMILTKDETLPIHKNPWFNLKNEENIDQVYDAYEKVAKASDDVLKAMDSLSINEAYQKVSLKDLLWLTNASLSKEDLLYMHQFHDVDVMKSLEASLDSLLKATKNTEYYAYQGTEDIYEMSLFLAKSLIPKELTKAEIEGTLKASYLFIDSKHPFMSDKDIQTLNKVCSLMETLKEEKEKHLYEAYHFYKKDLTEKDTDLIWKSYEALHKYKLEGLEEPKLLDVKAKGAYKKLSTLSFLENPTFKEIVDATEEYYLALEKDKEYEKSARSLAVLFQRALSKEEIAQINAVYHLSQTTHISLEDFVRAIQKDALKVLDYFQAFAFKENNPTFNELKMQVDYQIAFQKYREVICEFISNTSFENKCQDDSQYIALGKCVLATYHVFLHKEILKEDIDTIQMEFDSIRKNPTLSETISKFFEALIRFNLSYFNTYYYTNRSELTYKDMLVLSKEIRNRNNLSSSLKYHQLLTLPNALDLSSLFQPFEEGKISTREVSVEDLFMHSAFGIALSGYLKRGSKLKYGAGKDMFFACSKLMENEHRLEDIHAELMERKLMDSIHPNDASYDFLEYEKDTGTIRALFKNHSNALLSLKKCFIMSPATASVLFKSKDYENFDVVIIDEASQLEPVEALPVLYRSKQTIIVGDEWQMPPIKHFKIKGEKSLSMDEFEDPENSLLGLAIKNLAFKSYMLRCHYRSKTESLIKFSQNNFYPLMQTFPAPIPKTNGIGFRDIYVENATCEKGANLEEAKKVIEELHRLFDMYYKDGILQESVGVVGFGENQIDLILSLVERDKELAKMIATAKNNFQDEIKEKLIFFKTIETVQGQEIDHLILSMTYGVRADGRKTNSFGQLNASKLGQCIFNVAVTRSKASICVIHSILPQEIDETTNIGFLKEYLNISEYFSNQTENQFVGQDLEKGFVSEVVDYLTECGVPRDQIVYQYGVTKGSIRIPIAILDSKKENAVLGIWCEKNSYQPDHYVDETIRYYAVLKSIGWNFTNVYILDWYLNQMTVKDDLKRIVEENKGRIRRSL